MSSFLKQAYALEQEVVEEVTEVDGDELIETVEETEAAQHESEALRAEVERAIAVHDEIENQNETLEEIAETQEEVTPEVAAMAEVARRTAAAGLGLNPDEEGAELVDEAGLESLVVSKSTVALEDAKEVAQKLWKKIQELWQAFVQRCQQFWSWLGKLVNNLLRMNKNIIETLKVMKDAEFNEALAKFVEADKQANRKLTETAKAAFDKNGKLFNLASDVDKAFAETNKIKTAVDAAVAKVLTKDIAKTDGLKAFEGIKRTDINVLNTQLVIDENGAKPFRFWKHDNVPSIPAEIKITRSDLIAALEASVKASKDVEKFASESFKRYTKVKDEVKGLVDPAKLSGKEVKTYDRNVKLVLNARQQVYQLETSVVRKVTEITKAYNKIAKAVTGKAK